jgi:ABC-type branched-subunit amino acid transport system permease subunit
MSRLDLGGHWGQLTGTERGVTGALAVILALLLVGVLTGFIAPAYLVFLVGLAAMYALMSLGLNAQWGFSGLINFSIAAFFGIGAYGTALMTADSSPIAGGLSPVLGVLVALVVSAIIAVLIGIPTLRLGADYLAIATLGLAEVLRLIALNEQWLTNGSAGVRGIPQFFAGWPVLDGLPAALPGFRVELIPGQPFFFEQPFYQAVLNFVVVLAFLTVSYLILRRAHRSPWGRVLRTIRSDEDLAEALGKNTYWYKMQAFVLGSLVMALAGVFAAHLIRFVGPSTLDPLTTFYVWVAVILGGSGSNRGALIGGFVIVAIREGTRFASDLINFVVGVLPEIVVDGIFGLIDIVNTLLPLVNMQSLPDPAPLRLLIIGLVIIVVMRYRPEGLLPPQKELIWPGTVDDTPAEVERGVREARGDVDE